MNTSSHGVDTPRAPALWLLFAVAFAAFPYSVYRIFLLTPIEREMGTAQKIFYFHVPLAWICMLFAVISGVAAGIQLARRSANASAVAAAAAELCVLAGIGVLVTGPIWGNATWGTPWTGDARQVSTALLWLVFVAYLVLARFGPANADRLAAALAVFGAVNVPIVYYAVRIWRTTHPTTNVVPTLPRDMWGSLWPALVALLACSFGLFILRMRQERLARALDQAWIDLDHDTAAPRRDA